MTVKSDKSKASAYKNPIDAYVKKGIQFESGHYHVVELFPAPLPREGEDFPIDTMDDLFFTSGMFGFDEIFVPDDSAIIGTVDGEEITFERHDFLSWQLMRTNAFTLLCLAAKIETDGEKLGLLLGDSEELPEDYYFEYLTKIHYMTEENIAISLKFIERLKAEHPQEFMETLVTNILHDGYGVTEWLETEIDNDNFPEVCEMYAHWEEPLMLVSFGVFSPYITPEDDSHLMRDGYKLIRTYVRNYDENEINEAN